MTRIARHALRHDIRELETIGEPRSRRPFQFPANNDADFYLAARLIRADGLAGCRRKRRSRSESERGWKTNVAAALLFFPPPPSASLYPALYTSSLETLPLPPPGWSEIIFLFSLRGSRADSAARISLAESERGTIERFERFVRSQLNSRHEFTAPPV